MQEATKQHRDNYPRLTQAQVDLWLEEPVTKLLTQCLEWWQDDVRDHVSSGACIDRENSDKTLSSLCESNGNIQGLCSAGLYEEVFARYEMITKEVKDADSE